MRAEARLHKDTVWLTQWKIAETLDPSPNNVQIHLRNIFASGELDARPTVKDFLVVRSECQCQVRRRFERYNPNAAISVGHPFNSCRRRAPAAVPRPFGCDIGSVQSKLALAFLLDWLPAPILTGMNDLQGARAQRSVPVEPVETSESAKAKAAANANPAGLPIHSCTMLQGDSEWSP